MPEPLESITVRVPRSLRDGMRYEAKRDGLSLSALAAKTLSENHWRKVGKRFTFTTKYYGSSDMRMGKDA